jgi:hypothetical protein
MPKISQLPTLEIITTGSIIPVVENSITQKLTVGKLFEFLSGALDQTFTTEVELLRSASSITSSFNTFATASILNVNTKLSTSSFEAYTSSNNEKWNTLGGQTGSFVTEAETGSFVTNVSMFLSKSAFDTYTGSAANAVSSAINAATSSLSSSNATLDNIQLFTSSFNTFTSSVNSFSASVNGKTGSYATTGSNQFNGNQSVTGSLIVSGGFEVKNSGYSWSFNSNGTTLLPTVLTGDTSIGTTFNTNPPGHTLTIKHNGGVSGGSGGELQFDYGNAKIKVVKDVGTTHTWSFNSDGTTTFPNDIIDGGLNKVEIKSSNYVEMHYAEEDGVWQNFTATSQNAYVYADPDGVGIQNLRGNDGNGGPEWNHTWRFNKDGAIALPGGGTISSNGGVNNNAIKLTPAFGANENQALLIYPTAGVPEGNHIHLTANGGTTELYLGDDNHFVKLSNSGSVDIQAFQPVFPYSASTWTFGIDGAISTTDNLILNVPNGVVSSIGIKSNDSQFWDYNYGSNLATTGGTGVGLTVNVGDGGSGYANISINTAGTGYTDGDVITVTNGPNNGAPIASTATFTIGVSGTNSWEFNIDGDLIFPDSTIQTTAFIPTTLVTTSSFNTFTSSVNTFSASVNGKTGSFATTGSNTFVGNQIVSGTLTIATNGGDEGGEILLEKAVTNTTLTGSGVVVDIFRDRVRIFEESGTTRGAFLNVASQSAGVSSQIVTSPNLFSIQTITSASYAALTPVSGTLYIIIG